MKEKEKLKKKGDYTIISNTGIKNSAVTGY